MPHLTRHQLRYSALPLLMLGILTDDSHLAETANNLALHAHLFN